MAIRIEAPLGENVPRLELHGPLCLCTDCVEKGAPPAEIVVVPWTPQREEGRAADGPPAVLEFGGLRVEITLGYLRALRSAVAAGAQAWPSAFSEAHILMRDVLQEMERRMWRGLGKGKL